MTPATSSASNTGSTCASGGGWGGPSAEQQRNDYRRRSPPRASPRQRPLSPQQPTAGQLRGTVADNFDLSKGYGFIVPSDGSGDMFLHVSEFAESSGELRPGIAVQYDVMENRRNGKRMASNVSADVSQQPQRGDSGGRGGGERLRGTVAKWDVDRHFGFLRPDGESEDIFCLGRKAGLQVGEWLRVGDIVTYEKQDDPQAREGWSAVNVSVQGQGHGQQRDDYRRSPLRDSPRPQQPQQSGWGGSDQLGASGGGGGSSSWPASAGARSTGGWGGVSDQTGSGNDFGMMSIDDHQPPPAQAHPPPQPVMMRPPAAAPVATKLGPKGLARRAARLKREREAGVAPAASPLAPLVVELLDSDDEDAAAVPSPAKRPRHSPRAQQLFAEAQAKLQEAKAAAQREQAEQAAQRAAGETSSVLSTRDPRRQAAPQNGLEAEKPQDKPCFMLLTKKADGVAQPPIGWLICEDVGDPGWRADGFGFAVPDVLEVNIGQNNFRLVHGRFQTLLLELPFKTLEASGVTAERRWARFVDNALMGGEKAAVVVADGAVFYLTQERFYYRQGEDDAGAPHRVVEENSSELQRQSSAPIADLISPQPQASPAGSLASGGGGGYGMAGGL
jgi:CspA family cold shock protein